MENSDIEALQSMIQPYFRTHTGSMASGPFDHDEIVRNALAKMTAEKRANFISRVTEAMRYLDLAGG